MGADERLEEVAEPEAAAGCGGGGGACGVDAGASIARRRGQSQITDIYQIQEPEREKLQS